MIRHILNWRQDATANTDRDTESQGFGVRELRPACRYPDAHQAEEEKCDSEAAEKEQVQGLAFSLSAPLAFGSLSLLTFASKAIPRQSSARNLRAYKSESFGVRQLAPIVTEGTKSLHSHGVVDLDHVLASACPSRCALAYRM